MNDDREDWQSLLEDQRDGSRRNINEGVRLYRKYRRRAMFGALMAIVLSGISMMLTLAEVDGSLTGIAAAGLLGFAIGEYRAYKELENLPIIGYLIAVNHALGGMVMTDTELAEASEQRRMREQQYEESGFASPMGM